MPIVTRNRTISPNTRKETSRSYKVDTKNVMRGDTLVVNIDHANKAFTKQFSFSGNDVSNRDSISFRVREEGNNIQIVWSGAMPLGSNGVKPRERKSSPVMPKTKVQPSINGKVKSLKPISNKHSKVLILGTMPGVESLRQQAYYGHPRNLFWKLIEEVTGKQVPITYEDRKTYLLQNHIALWDVCQSCFREGSLDKDISGEVPNDLTTFLSQHPNIKAIAFNGQSAAKLFGKHLGSISGIRLLGLPSSSPSNAGVSWEVKVEEWRVISDSI